MKQNSIAWAQRSLLLLVVSLVTPAQRATAQFVELSAEIEITSYRSGQTNAEANPKPRLISVVCMTGTNRWRIENVWSQNSVSQWVFDGTNVYESVRITRPLS